MSWIPGWDSIAGANAGSNFFFWASIGALILLGVSEIVSHRYSERKDYLTAQEQDATQRQHDEEIARLHLETANANNAAEELRQKNLELEAAIAPRGLEQGHSSAALKQFAGTQVLLASVPDFEARRFASQFTVMFQMAGWKYAFLPPDENIRDGVEVEYVAGIRDDPNNPGGMPDFHFNDRVDQAAQALIAELKKQKIETRRMWMPPRVQDEGQRAAPVEAIVVRVGLKPSTYFLEAKFPELKAIREKSEEAEAEMNCRVEEMKKRVQDRVPTLHASSEPRKVKPQQPRFVAALSRDFPRGANYPIFELPDNRLRKIQITRP